jgi:TrmH family RNA methyltransferase
MDRTEVITSAANPLLKEVRRALSRGVLTADGYAVAETFHLLEEALRSGCEMPVVLAAESMESAVETLLRRRPGVRRLVIADRIFNRLASTESSQGVIALVRPAAWTLEQLFTGRSLLTVLDGVQDPGNAGTIVRAAEAFGATGAIFVKGSVSPYNPKTMRASAGSLFRAPFVSGVDAASTLAALAQHGVDIYATVPAGNGGARALGEVDLTRPCALIVGSEARGVSADLRAGALDLFIPTEHVESLNAAVACGILLYEAWRQRSLPR